MRDDEINTGVPIPAMPHSQPVEAHETLENRKPGEQNDLDQGEIGAQQTRQTAGARQSVARRARVEIASVHPEPDDDGGVPEDDEREQREL